MSEVPRIEQGDPHVAAQLLPLIYDELRRLAATDKTAAETPGEPHRNRHRTLAIGFTSG
jgi:hypothetical protein